MSSWTNRIASLALVVLSACSAPTPGHVGVGAGAQAGAIKTPATAIDRVALRAQLAAHRAQQIAHLQAYGEAGQFPHNTTTAPSLHMFRDPEGRLCAVANLVQTDGRADLVETTVRDHNDLAVADVHDGPMMDWMVSSGLTQEELVAIQAPAPMIMFTPPKPKHVTPPPINVAKPTPPAMSESQMNAAILHHVEEMEAALKDGTERSLDVAVERYVAAHAASS
jgi:hypothetical protein